jgi:hypothetical protein
MGGESLTKNTHKSYNKLYAKSVSAQWDLAEVEREMISSILEGGLINKTTYS